MGKREQAKINFGQKIELYRKIPRSTILNWIKNTHSDIYYKYGAIDDANLKLLLVTQEMIKNTHSHIYYKYGAIDEAILKLLLVTQEMIFTVSCKT